MRTKQRMLPFRGGSCPRFETLTRVRNERSRKSRVFVPGGRIESQHAALTATSTILPPSILQSKLIHNTITPNGNPSLNGRSYETPPNFQTTSGSKNNSRMPENENEKLDTKRDEAAAAEERGRSEANAERLRKEEKTRKTGEGRRPSSRPKYQFYHLQRTYIFIRIIEPSLNSKSRVRRTTVFRLPGCQITRNAAPLDEDSTVSPNQEDRNTWPRQSSSTAGYERPIIPDELGRFYLEPRIFS